MSVQDYNCARMDCDKEAIAVSCSRTGACYGACAEHLPRLDPGETWVWAPPTDPIAVELTIEEWTYAIGAIKCLHGGDTLNGIAKSMSVQVSA